MTTASTDPFFRSMTASTPFLNLFTFAFFTTTFSFPGSPNLSPDEIRSPVVPS